MQVALRDVLAVLARELVEGLSAVAMLVVPIRSLDFPVMNDVGVRVTGAGVAITERVLRLLQRL